MTWGSFGNPNEKPQEAETQGRQATDEVEDMGSGNRYRQFHDVDQPRQEARKKTCCRGDATFDENSRRHRTLCGLIHSKRATMALMFVEIGLIVVIGVSLAAWTIRRHHHGPPPPPPPGHHGDNHPPGPPPPPPHDGDGPPPPPHLEDSIPHWLGIVDGPPEDEEELTNGTKTDDQVVADNKVAGEEDNEEDEDDDDHGWGDWTHHRHHHKKHHGGRHPHHKKHHGRHHHPHHGRHGGCRGIWLWLPFWLGLVLLSLLGLKRGSWLLLVPHALVQGLHVCLIAGRLLGTVFVVVYQLGAGHDFNYGHAVARLVWCVMSIVFSGYLLVIVLKCLRYLKERRMAVEQEAGPYSCPPTMDPVEVGFGGVVVKPNNNNKAEDSQQQAPPLPEKEQVVVEA